MQLATLPLVLAVVLLELATGGAFLIWALDRTKQAPLGFLKLTAGTDAACGILAFLLLPALPRGSLAESAQLHPAALDSLALAVTVLAVLLVAQLLTTFVPWRTLRAVVSLVTILVGGATLLAAAVARPGDQQYNVFALAALPLGAIALGGVDAAMLLGHWYLVTPKLSPLPLQRASLIVVAAIVLQGVVVAVTVAHGELVGALDTSSLAVAIGIRIGVGIVMTLALVVAAWWTARMNTQSSTGLLYVGLGTALAGEVAARVLFYLTGVPI
ncbi:MAG: hypothetical protein KGJ98_03745 [Chloroflexota bacterium]|nr:hypothetical protein [Chloroflexota bacterium]MDE3101327.1 hypothetical protein [Chloroflexota bacterium]